MHLAKIRDTASKFATVISRILDVDVMIVDNSFVRIANTYRYVDEPPPVRPNSITGHVITSGKVVVVSDKQDYEGCRACKDRGTCLIAQIVGVPIFYDGQTMGAIDLLVPSGKHSSVFDNLELTIDFLERMADLLSSKLQNLDDYERLSMIRKEREIVLDFVEDALVYANETGEVVYWNNQFGKLFNLDKSSEGRMLTDIIDHPLIRGAFQSQKQFSNQAFAYADGNLSFSGFLSYRIIQKNGVKYGTMFLLKSLDNAFGVLNDTSEVRACSSFDAFRTEDKAMQAALDLAKKLAVTEEPLFILGPQGAGKSILARSIHAFSDHADRPFIVVDCAAFSSEYLETEIFGLPESEGTEASPTSKLRIAQNGTIYFMRADKLPLHLQSRLVALMKARTLSGKGDIAARMLFSSNRDVAALAADGLFDEELAIRIAQNTVRIPPLSERPGDIVVLARHFLDKFNRIYEKRCGITEEALKFLCSLQWEENSRQVEQTMERIVRASPGAVIDMCWLRNMPGLNPKTEPKAIESLETVERKQIEKALKSYPNRDDVARVLGIGRATLYRKLKEYGLNGTGASQE